MPSIRERLNEAIVSIKDDLVSIIHTNTLNVQSIVDPSVKDDEKEENPMKDRINEFFSKNSLSDYNSAAIRFTELVTGIKPVVVRKDERIILTSDHKFPFFAKTSSGGRLRLIVSVDSDRDFRDKNGDYFTPRRKDVHFPTLEQIEEYMGNIDVSDIAEIAKCIRED